MNTLSEVCKLKHKYRGQNDFCSLCGEGLKWIKNRAEDYWVPVDAKPVMYEPDIDGRYIIYDRFHKKIPFAKVYKKGGPELNKPRQGHIPHYFTCPVLLERRRDYCISKVARR